MAALVPGLWHSVSYTTRKPRPGEVEGRDYFYIEEADFLQMIERNEFVEWARVYGNLYGTPRKPLSDKMEQGIDVLLEIDVQGARTVKKKFEDGVYIFILPPSFDVLRTRLQSRAETRRKKSSVGSKKPKKKYGVIASTIILSATMT